MISYGFSSTKLSNLRESRRRGRAIELLLDHCQAQLEYMHQQLGLRQHFP